MSPSCAGCHWCQRPQLASPLTKIPALLLYFSWIANVWKCIHCKTALQTKEGLWQSNMGGADFDSLAKRVEDLERRVGSRWRGGWWIYCQRWSRVKEMRKKIIFYFLFVMIAKTTMTCFNKNVTQAWATASGSSLGRVQHWLGKRACWQRKDCAGMKANHDDASA